MLQTFTDYLQQIFGTYQPIINYDNSGVAIDTSVNFGYICAVVIFCVVLYCILKLIGGVIHDLICR